MTKDVIALTPAMPDTAALIVALAAGGTGLDAASTADGAVIQLLGAGGLPLVSVEAPVLVQVPGEVERLLGTSARTPVWWTETRASTAVPEAAELAGAVAGRLAEVLGGAVWPPARDGSPRCGSAPRPRRRPRRWGPCRPSTWSPSPPPSSSRTGP